MKRISLIGLLILVVSGVAGVLISRPDLLVRVGLGGDSATLMRITRSFLEDIQFKDFSKAASYHSPDEQDHVDIPFLLERLFFIKPEQLDVMDYEVLFVKIDSSGLRARSKVRIKVKNLLKGEINERELMLYFYRKNQQSPWFMKLESSLRNLKGDEKKLH